MLGEALALIEAGAADCLLVYDVDRLSREPVHHAVIMERIEEADAQIEYVLSDSSKTASARLMLGIKREFSKYENDQRTERFMRCKRGAVADGRVVSSRAPFGYEKSGHTFAVVESEAEIVRLIYQWYLSGKGSTWIARS